MIPNPGYEWDRVRIEGDRIHHIASRSIPHWLQSVLRVPLELKVFGANLMIMAAAVLLLFGPLTLEPTRLTDALIVVAALGVGAVVNFGLVRLALRPVKDIARIAWLVSEGVRGERVPDSIVADSELTQLSATINQLLDELVSERIQINKLAADIAKTGGSDGRRRRFDRRVSGVQR